MPIRPQHLPDQDVVSRDTRSAGGEGVYGKGVLWPADCLAKSAKASI